MGFDSGLGLEKGLSFCKSGFKRPSLYDTAARGSSDRTIDSTPTSTIDGAKGMGMSMGKNISRSRSNSIPRGMKYCEESMFGHKRQHQRQRQQQGQHQRQHQYQYQRRRNTGSNGMDVDANI